MSAVPGDGRLLIADTISTLKRCIALVEEANGLSTANTSVQHLPNGITKDKTNDKVCPSNVDKVLPTAANHSESTAAFDGVKAEGSEDDIKITTYRDESQMPHIMGVITKELSEPYSIYTYRYFIHNWPELCLLARDIKRDCQVGVIVCKLDKDRCGTNRGYIAMLAVEESVRRLGIGTKLVKSAIDVMKDRGCDEVVLETEVTNAKALNLYSKLGFIREKRLLRYYLNGVDAFRLKLFFTPRSLRSFSPTVSEHGHNDFSVV
jgi:peptide alpha-N-acetyltransferase